MSTPQLDALPPLRDALAEHGILANKGFGQHFLLDLNITRKIARLAGPLDDCVTIEVGPGPGGLTRALLEAGGRVVAVEKDPRFLPLLAELQTAAPGQLTLVQDDALKADERALADAVRPGAPVRIVANLPYNVGTPLLIKWLTGPLRPQSMTLMFQKEVAQRIVAEVDTDAYGRLGVICQALAEAQIVMDLPARAFTPPPKVASVVKRSAKPPGSIPRHAPRRWMWPDSCGWRGPRGPRFPRPSAGPRTGSARGSCPVSGARRGRYGPVRRRPGRSPH
jgi:16S rRNA (adenine1518-N6/adenine1519-N6)-dimethyltransferase